MPRIPLADIPNAPSLGPGPIAAGIPQVNTDLSGAARSLMTPTMQLDAFSGEAQGLQGLAQGLSRFGESGQRVADILHDASQRKQAFQDDVSFAQYDNRLSGAYARYKESLPGRPEAEYLSGWQQTLAKEREIARKDLALSPQGRARLDEHDTRFVRQTSRDLISAASHRSIERGTGEITAQAQRFFDAGRDEDAYATYGRLVDLGAITREQYDRQIRQWRDLRTDESLTSFMHQQPRAFIHAARSFEETGKNPLLDGLITEPEVAQVWRRKAEKHWRGVQDVTRQSVFGAISGEKITREDLIADSDMANLDTDDLDAIRLGLANRGGPLDHVIYGQLQLAAVRYDSAADPDGSRLAALDRQIVTHISGPQAATLLQQARSPMTPVRRQQGSLLEKMDIYARTGILGDSGRDPQENIVNMQKAQNVAMKVEALRLDMERFMQKNPEASARRVDEYFNDLTAGMGALMEGSKVFRQRLASPKSGEVSNNSNGDRGKALPLASWATEAATSFEAGANLDPGRKVELHLGGRKESPLIYLLRRRKGWKWRGILSRLRLGEPKMVH